MATSSAISQNLAAHVGRRRSVPDVVRLAARKGHGFGNDTARARREVVVLVIVGVETVSRREGVVGLLVELFLVDVAEGIVGFGDRLAPHRNRETVIVAEVGFAEFGGRARQALGLGGGEFRLDGQRVRVETFSGRSVQRGILVAFTLVPDRGARVGTAHLTADRPTGRMRSNDLGEIVAVRALLLGIRRRIAAGDMAQDAVGFRCGGGGLEVRHRRTAAARLAVRHLRFGLFENPLLGLVGKGVELAARPSLAS